MFFPETHFWARRRYLDGRPAGTFSRALVGPAGDVQYQGFGLVSCVIVVLEEKT